MNKKIVILHQYLWAKYCMRFSKKSLEKWQNKYKSLIYRFATANSPFYKENIGKLINKKTMMDNFSTFNTKQIDKKKAFEIATNAERSRDFSELLNETTIGLSSGTSGNRGIFLVSEAERLAWCGNIFAKILPKAPWKRQKIALFLRANSTLYQTVASKTLSFAYFDLLEDPNLLMQKLKVFDPDVLVAPPSMLLLLIGSCKPTRVISIAETLFTRDEERLEQAYNQKIFQIYQATEGFLGFTCSHGTLHLNEDLLIIEKEYIDHERFTPIITDLFRKTQPIIRYRLDDILVEQKTPCPCGCIFQSIRRIEGRCDDLLYVQSINGTYKPLFPDFISRRIISVSEQIQDFEVVQNLPNQWRIFLDYQFRHKVHKELALLISNMGCLLPEIMFTDQPFPKTPGSKMRRIRRECAAL